MRWLAEKENHRTKMQKTEAIIRKLFIVKFFNTMYPYVYIAVFKEHIEGCTSGEGFSCIAELQQSLAIFFFSSAVVDFLFACISWVFARQKISSEMRTTAGNSKEDQYTYLQVQAKLDDPWERHDEILTFIVQFGFVCSFTIAWPFMPTAALLYNFVMLKLLVYRRLRLFKRNFPNSAHGIGVWVPILKVTVVLACLVNTSIAVFGMEPLRSKPFKTQLMWFIGIEHILLLLVFVMFLSVPDVPVWMQRCEEKNEEMAPKIIDPEHTVMSDMVGLTPQSETLDSMRLAPDKFLQQQ